MTAPVQPRRLSPFRALLVSAAVLPGLGQMLTGRLTRGLIMAGLLALWLPAVIIKVGLDFLKIWPALAARAERGDPVTLGDIQAAVAPLAGGLGWVLWPLAAIWLWSVTDALIFLLRRAGPAKEA
ncbi:hypothetical protein FACS189460_3740 [Deltaproteobacteria bacterium]|nr:hypothetical protein FACS189460_3740 [Deltaproteobacteria bacterium]